MRNLFCELETDLIVLANFHIVEAIESFIIVNECFLSIHRPKSSQRFFSSNKILHNSEESITQSQNDKAKILSVMVIFNLSSGNADSIFLPFRVSFSTRVNEE